MCKNKTFHALSEIVDQLCRKRDTYIDYMNKSDEQRMPEWAARYGEIADAYQEAIDLINAVCMENRDD